MDAFLSGVQRIGTPKITGDKRHLSEQLKKAVATRNPHPSVIGMSLSGFQSSAYGIVDQQAVASSGPASVSFNINDQPQTLPNTLVPIIVTYTMNEETGHFALEWLRTEPFGQRLVDGKTGVVFPHLKVFWDRVSSLTDDQATVFLQEELSTTTRGTVSFFGISVETNLAVWAGSAVCLSILMFLGLHLRHFRSLGGDQHAAVRAYPWVPLFRGVWAQSATYTSVLLLPIVANAVLLHRYGHFSEWSTRIGASLVALMMAAGVWVLVEINRLHAPGPP